MDWYCERSGTLHWQPISALSISELIHSRALRHQTICCPTCLISMLSVQIVPPDCNWCLTVST